MRIISILKNSLWLILILNILLCVADHLQVGNERYMMSSQLKLSKDGSCKCQDLPWNFEW